MLGCVLPLSQYYFLQNQSQLLILQVSPPDQDFEEYLNRKFFTSINALITGGASMRIFCVVSDWPGSAHDCRIFQNSKLYEALEEGWRAFKGAKLIGDSAFFR